MSRRRAVRPNSLALVLCVAVCTYARGDGQTWVRIDDQVKIHHNTFWARRTPIVIRGTHEQLAVVSGNWFVPYDAPGKAVVASGKTQVTDNAFGQGEAIAVK